MDAVGVPSVFGFGIRSRSRWARRLKWVHSPPRALASALTPRCRIEKSFEQLRRRACIPIAEYVVAGVLALFRGLDGAARQRGCEMGQTFYVSEDSPDRIGGEPHPYSRTGGPLDRRGNPVSARVPLVWGRSRPSRGLQWALAGWSAHRPEHELSEADVLCNVPPANQRKQRPADGERLSFVRSSDNRMSRRFHLVDQDHLRAWREDASRRGPRRLQRASGGGMSLWQLKR